MNKIFKLSAILILISISFVSNAQVLMKDMLVQDQKGVVDNSVNWPGKKVYYNLKYDSTKVYSYDGYTANRYYFTLMMADNAGMNNAIKIPGMIRDLIITSYFEFYFNNGTETKTFTMIYDKNNKWSRIKFGPQWGCRREEAWKRTNDIKSYDQLLTSMVAQMDNNLKFDCFKGHTAEVMTH